MESVKEFLKIENFYGSDDDSGSGSGSGYGHVLGSGFGYGHVLGSGFGSDLCNGFGHGLGNEYGFDRGWGCGSGSGSGFGYGYGHGYGHDDDIKRYNSSPVYYIDEVPTIITKVRGNIAKGAILNKDLTLSPCFVAKGNNLFAHGETLRDAMQALESKIYEDMDSEEAIQMFLNAFPDINKKYPAKDFFIWHNRLTGSCEMGRQTFVRDNGIDLDHDEYTVQEFINITKNAYGGQIIRQLEEVIKEFNMKRIDKIYRDQPGAEELYNIVTYCPEDGAPCNGQCAQCAVNHLNEEVPDYDDKFIEKLKAIKLLWPRAKFLAMGENKQAYAYASAGRKMGTWWDCLNDESLRIPSLDGYSNDWGNSLIDIDQVLKDAE